MFKNTISLILFITLVVTGGLGLAQKTVAKRVLEAPTNLSVEPVHPIDLPNVELRLSWDDNSNNEKGFIIERDNVPIARVRRNVNSYIDTVHIPPHGAQFSYRVRAFRGSHFSDYSNIVLWALFP